MLRELNSATPLRPSTDSARTLFDAAKRGSALLLQRLTDLRGLAGVRRGVEWTRERCVVILQVVVSLMLVFQTPKTIACRFVQFTLGHSYFRVMQLATAYLGSGHLPAIVHRPRGPVPVAAEAFGAAYQRTIISQLVQWHDDGVAATSRMVQEFIADKCETRLSVRRVRWYLRLWGCVWGRVYEMPPVDPIMHRKRVGAVYHAAGTGASGRKEWHSCHHTDKSYIHDNHAIQFSWFPPNSTHRVARAKRRGRLITCPPVEIHPPDRSHHIPSPPLPHHRLVKMSRQGVAVLRTSQHPQLADVNVVHDHAQ